MTVKDLIIKTEKIPWRNLTPYQPDDFKKKLDKNQTEQLIQGIIDIGIATAFYVWEEDGKIYVFDGHQRLNIFPIMIERGIEIPDELTCNFVAAENKEHAINIVLAYNSHASEIDEKGFFNFIGDLDINHINKKFQFFNTGKRFFSYMEKIEKINTNKEIDTSSFDDKMILKFNYTEKEYFHIIEQLKNIDINKEKALLKLLNYDSSI